MARNHGGRRRKVCLVAVVAMLAACHTDPYETYASAVHRDVDQSAATLARAEARLELTVVHGHVPLDSATVWTVELGRAAKTMHERAAHLAKLGPPDPSLAREHDGLLAELTGIADSVGALGDAIASCRQSSRSRARTMSTSGATGAQRTPATDSLAALDAQIDSEARATADSADAACRASVGGALAELTRRVSFAQDELRWTRQRVGRKLATHGVLLGDVSLRRARAG